MGTCRSGAPLYSDGSVLNTAHSKKSEKPASTAHKDRGTVAAHPHVCGIHPQVTRTANIPIGDPPQNPKMANRPQTQEIQGTQASSPAPDPLLISPQTETSANIPHAGAASPASTESLIGHTMEDLLLLPMEESSSHSQGKEAHLIHHPDMPTNIADMFSRFADVLINPRLQQKSQGTLKRNSRIWAHA